MEDARAPLGSHQKVGDANTFIYLTVPFSSTTYFDYLTEFLLGLQLDTFYPSSSSCIYAVVYTLDAYAYFENNVTLTKAYGTTWDKPIMNFTQALGGSFATIPLKCFKFADEWYVDLLAKYELFDQSVGNYMLAFLFNQMGNALSFTSIFAEITQDEANQYYTDIAYQYGRLIRLIFNFQPITDAALYEMKHNATALEEMLEKSHYFENEEDVSMAASLINTFMQPLVGAYQPVKRVLKSSNAAYPLFEAAAHSAGVFVASLEQTFGLTPMAVPVDSTYTDDLEIAWGVSQGFFAGISLALPTTSLLYSCQTNITLVSPAYANMVTYLSKGGVENIKTGLTYYQTMMGLASNATYYCFYSAYTAVSPTTYTTKFTPRIIGYNILYGLGYMYTDWKNIYVYYNKGSTAANWTTIAQYFGDFVMKFFFRKVTT